MRLTVIGSGTAAPHPERVCAGNLVEAGSSRVLLDCGNGVLFRMAQLGVDWQAITHVALTHFHYDHVGDLPALITAFRWGQLPPRTEPLTLIGPIGTKEWLTRVAAAHGEWVVEPGYPLTVIEAESPSGFSLRLPTSHFTLSTFPVSHSESSIAYSIAGGRARLVYTGDTSYSDALADWAAGCDVLLTECSLPAAFAMAQHLTPESAGAFAARAKPGQLVLTHFYPPVEHEDIPSLVRQRWPGPLVLARDGTVVEIEE
jgi:ribonuclease BN (tRNA processing enzyme)